MEHIVVDRENLFVVVLPRDAVWNFVEINELIDEYQQSLIARAAQKQCKELQKVVPVVIGDHQIDAELRFSLCARRIFSAQPFHDTGADFVLAGFHCTEIPNKQLRKLVAVEHFAQSMHALENFGFAAGEKFRRSGPDAFGGQFRPQPRHPALQNQSERSAFGHGFRCEVLHQFTISGEPLSFRAGQTPFG